VRDPGCAAPLLASAARADGFPEVALSEGGAVPELCGVARRDTLHRQDIGAVTPHNCGRNIMPRRPRGLRARGLQPHRGRSHGPALSGRPRPSRRRRGQPHHGPVARSPPDGREPPGCPRGGPREEEGRGRGDGGEALAPRRGQGVRPDAAGGERTRWGGTSSGRGGRSRSHGSRSSGPNDRRSGGSNLGPLGAPAAFGRVRRSRPDRYRYQLTIGGSTRPPVRGRRRGQRREHPAPMPTSQRLRGARVLRGRAT
jgi:hypothetical protein